MSCVSSASIRSGRIAMTAIATAFAAFLSAGPFAAVTSAQASPPPGAPQPAAPRPGTRGGPGGMRGDAGPGWGGSREGMRAPMHHGDSDPVVAMLDKQVVLELTPAEVNQLITIHEQTIQQARPLHAKMTALVPKDREAWRTMTPSTRDSLGALMESMRVIRWRATSAATAVLTDGQREKAAHLFERGGRGHGGQGWGRERGGRGMRGPGMRGPGGDGPGHWGRGAPKDGMPGSRPAPPPGPGAGSGAAEGSAGTD
jgi:hypothetical protein